VLALETPSLIANSSALEVVVLLAGVFENDILWSSLQKCIAEMACMFLESIAFTSVTTIRVEKKSLKIKKDSK